MKSLIRASIDRPHAVVVCAVTIVVLGVLAAWAVPVDILPANRSPAVQILTFYGGMPADAVAKSITSRVERQTGQAAGRRRQESRSIVGASIVRNYFRDNVDLNSALAQVNSLSTAAYKNMPPGTDPPVILPFDPTGTTPVCVIALDSETETEETLYDIGRYEVRNMIMGSPGANAPSIHGGKHRAILAYLDRHKLEARNLSPLDVVNAMDEYNLFLPTGDVQFGDTNYALDSNAMFQAVEAMGDIPLHSDNGQITLLNDVATPTDSSLVQTSLVRVNGRRQTYIPVFRQAGASTLAVVDNLRASLQDMTDRLSRGGIDLKLVMDQSVYVRQSIVTLVEEAVLGAVMCSLIILLFLGNLRMTGIAVMTIPLAILAAVMGLYMTGNTINVMTLAGLALAIGPLVDLSVICLENTHRCLGLTRSPREAAIQGTGEVAMPALVATCCTLLVLAPLAAIPDLGKFLFLPMALAVGFAMIAAYLLSQTLVPVCCAAWLKPHAASHGTAQPNRSLWERLFSRWEAVLIHLNSWYGSLLNQVLRVRPLVLLAAVGFLTSTVIYLGPELRRELFPEVDSGAFEMTVRAPSGTALEFTEARIAEVEDAIRTSVGDDLELIISEAGVVAGWVAAYTPNAGPMDAALKVQLTPDRRRTVQEHVRILRHAFQTNPRFANLEFGFDTGGLIRAAMNEGKSTPINVQLTGRNLPLLRQVAEQIRAEVSAVEGVVDARILQRYDYPQYVIDVDRSRAADLGLSLPYVVKNVISALNGSIQFHKQNFFIDPQTYNQYFVGVQYPEYDIQSIETLLDIPITSPVQKQSIPLRNLVTLRQSTVSTEVVHHDVQSTVELVMATDGRGLGQTAEDVAAVLDRFGVRRPDGSWTPFDPDAAADQAGQTLAGSRIHLSGEYSRMQEMFRNLGAGLLMSTLLIYLVMVVLFRSFRLPLAIIGSVPVGIGGVVVMLYLTDTAINVQSLLGVIFMISIVVANTVLLIDFAQNLRRESRLSTHQAILQAAVIRFRPVLMTALVALLALLPMALALVQGAEANAPLGRAVIGGLLAGLVTTLFVTPCLYTFIAPALDSTRPQETPAQIS
jgi:multidrug efflux pump subunit AcrB